MSLSYDHFDQLNFPKIGDLCVFEQVKGVFLKFMGFFYDRFALATFMSSIIDIINYL